MQRKVIATGCLAVLCVIGWLVCSYDPNPAFAAAIRHADTIIVRNGGFDCCGNDVDSQDVLLKVTDPEVVARFAKNIVFERRLNLIRRSRCRCCGYPGIDWYSNGRRIALTGMQHGRAVRWSGFMRDEALTASSAKWLRRFLKGNGIPERQVMKR